MTIGKKQSSLLNFSESSLNTASYRQSVNIPGVAFLCNVRPVLVAQFPVKNEIWILLMLVSPI